MSERVMLPSELLVARVSGGSVRPVYAELNPMNIDLAKRLLATYAGSVGRKKGELARRILAFEGEEPFDYRFVRGLSTLLERRTTFRIDATVDPKTARMAVFEEASRVGVTTVGQRDAVLERVAGRLGVDDPKTLLESLYADLDDELLVQGFELIAPENLLRFYNLSLTQTLLFKSLRMQFTTSGGWKRIFREVKKLGLMYAADKDQETGEVRITLDGPLSLFKMTDRYGTALAKLLPVIIASERWTIEAEILRKFKGKVVNFRLEKKQAEGLLTEAAMAAGSNGEGSATSSSSGASLHEERPSYDSTVEERFAKSFKGLSTGWELKREPEPLVAGNHVLIPDFSLEKDGVKVYLEIVGFWTPGYLQRKMEKLNTITDVDLIVAVDESLACAKLQKLKFDVLYYTGSKLPLKRVLDHLRKLEEGMARIETRSGAMEAVLRAGWRPSGDLFTLADLSRACDIPFGLLKSGAESLSFEGYTRMGGFFASQRFLAELGEKLSTVKRLPDALDLIRASGIVDDELNALEAAGYAVEWKGIDPATCIIVRRAVTSQ